MEFEEKELEECPVCDEEKEYYVNYHCNEKHIVCLDCRDDKCYYRCKENNIKQKLLINTVFRKFHFFK